MMKKCWFGKCSSLVDPTYNEIHERLNPQVTCRFSSLSRFSKVVPLILDDIAQGHSHQQFFYLQIARMGSASFAYYDAGNTFSEIWVFYANSFMSMDNIAMHTHRCRPFEHAVANLFVVSFLLFSHSTSTLPMLSPAKHSVPRSSPQFLLRQFI